MIKANQAFSGFSVDDLIQARTFYTEVLGVEVEDTSQGLRLKIGIGILVYPKEDHVAATYTILNFPVDDIDRSVADLKQKGVRFELYPGVTDHMGIARGIASGFGPDIAWFTDPAGNILSILKEG